jgi:UDP-glucose:(heptosyl)LPS alpha-1,3-glucosyltransferase
MRVALVAIRYDNKGGSERRTCHLARGLVREGHQVEIFAASIKDVDIPAAVNRVGMSSGPSFMKVLSFTGNVLDMLSKRTDIDVVHSQIRPFTDGVVTVGGGCHAEYLDRIGGRFSWLNPLHAVVLRMEKERYRQGGCKAVITNSEFSRQGILRHYPIPPESVHVAYNGVDSHRFSPERSRVNRAELREKYGLGDGPAALFLGSGFERKGLATAIEAVARVDGLKLLVAGKDDAGPYIRLARRLGADDRVVFAGETAAPEHFYGAADIYILPTKYDPFSNAAIEAMSCGLPVVTTTQNGVAEVMERGVDGLVVDSPEDADGFVEALVQLMDPGIRQDIGERARAKASGFTWDRTLEKTLEVYRKA